MLHLQNETSANVIKNYHLKRPFSSFLPGVAGMTGIPIWCFYTNRGQGISGFGIKDKNSPMMEFFPANLAYQYVNTTGFRTFIKMDGQVFEPFTRTPDTNERNLGITKDAFFIEEVLKQEELIIRVTYSTLNQLPIGGLIRRVEIQNTSNTPKEIEVIDGMPAIIPYGLSNTAYKEMSNLFRSWMEVLHAEEKIPFYKLRSSTADTSEVEQIESGFFYMNNAINNKDVAVFYDAKCLFSYKTDLSEMVAFKTKSIHELSKQNQISENKVPCAFQGVQLCLSPDQSAKIDSVFGFAKTYEQLQEITSKLNFSLFVTDQINATTNLVEEITADLDTYTGNEQVNAYFKQSYLDNVLRGGKPFVFGRKQQVCHLYSRKHGDQEREYNFFSLEPKFFSQGNGNYRDVNQNRRHDVILEPKVKDFNIWMFYSLIQSDGYNPLSIHGVVYKIDQQNFEAVQSALAHLVTPSQVEVILRAMKEPFTPGDLIDKIQGYNMEGAVIIDLIHLLLDFSTAEIDATFGEGYWSDHFTYNLDLVEDYVSIYPDKIEEMLIKRNDYKIFNSPERVLPRQMRIGMTKSGQIRQYGSLEKKKSYDGKWMKDSNGRIIQTNLINKMLLLVVTKFLNLDPSGMGIDMEGNKPGWNDAMNGIPGLFGSGMSESIELLRHIRFIKSTLEKEVQVKNIAVFQVVANLLEGISTIHGFTDKGATLCDENCQLIRWNQRNLLKENYREATQQHFDGQAVDLSVESLNASLEMMGIALEQGIEKALELGKGIMPTYWVHEVVEYRELPHKTPYGLIAVEPLSFRARQLPYFLEAPARYLKTTSAEKAHAMYMKVKESGIYDTQLKMYKTSESLEAEGMEIGRIRAFTPGWLERESVFLHMSYKYILGLAKANLWDEFYESAKTNLVPFLSQEVYGRPTTENSSFIASSVNPDPDVVGQGFVARLSGSTAEAISMWKLMMVGKYWFQQEDGQLTFTFDPHLTQDLFHASGECRFQLLSKTLVTYLNKTGKNTFGKDKATIQWMETDGHSIEGNQLKGEIAHDLREGKLQKIVIVFG